jgi:hypothetical protein
MTSAKRTKAAVTNQLKWLKRRKKENIQQRGVSAQYGNFFHQVKSKALQTPNRRTEPGTLDSTTGMYTCNLG